MSSRFEEFAQNKLAILTFNYDRSLEEYLYQTLTSTYRKPDPVTKEALATLEIVHLHGRLGPLPWQNDRGRPYDPEATARQIKLASEGIKIVHEAADDSEDFKLARRLLAQGERVYFLGFGYGSDNLDRLRLDVTFNKNAAIYGTAFDLMTVERQAVESKFGSPYISFGRKEDDIFAFFRETASL